jgi:hypothetical protein
LRRSSKFERCLPGCSVVETFFTSYANEVALVGLFKVRNKVSFENRAQVNPGFLRKSGFTCLTGFFKKEKRLYLFDRFFKRKNSLTCLTRFLSLAFRLEMDGVWNFLTEWWCFLNGTPVFGSIATSAKKIFFSIYYKFLFLTRAGICSVVERAKLVKLHF